MPETCSKHRRAYDSSGRSSAVTRGKGTAVQHVNAGDTAWMLTSAALVLFMTPGLALFYAGMVRGKNVLSTIMYSLIAMGVVTVLWALLGYTIAFGHDIGGVVGGLDFVGMRDVIGHVSPWAPRDSRGR